MKEIKLQPGDCVAIYDQHGTQKTIFCEDYCADGLTILPPKPKPKTVKLSELPDGTVISVITGEDNRYICYLSTWLNDLSLWREKSPEIGYLNPIHSDLIKSLKIIESPKQVWEGGECPYPNGVKVRCCYRDGIIEEGNAIDFEWNWNSERIANHRRSEIIWHQAISLLDDWEIKK